MTQVLWKVHTAGAHVHVRVFTRTLPTETWAKCGDLTFDIREWVHILPTVPQEWEVEPEVAKATIAVEYTTFTTESGP